MKINFDRLHKLLLCFKISRLENNAGARAHVFYMASISRRRGGRGGRGKKKGARRLARFNVWLAHGCFATSCTEFSRQAEVVSALYTNCVIYIPQLRGSRAPRPLFLAKIFSITPPTYPRKRRKIILKKKKKIEFPPSGLLTLIIPQPNLLNENRGEGIVVDELFSFFLFFLEEHFFTRRFVGLYIYIYSRICRE